MRLSVGGLPYSKWQYQPLSSVCPILTIQEWFEVWQGLAMNLCNGRHPALQRGDVARRLIPGSSYNPFRSRLDQPDSSNSNPLSGMLDHSRSGNNTRPSSLYTQIAQAALLL